MSTPKHSTTIGNTTVNLPGKAKHVYETAEGFLVVVSTDDLSPEDKQRNILFFDFDGSLKWTIAPSQLTPDLWSPAKDRRPEGIPDTFASCHLRAIDNVWWAGTFTGNEYAVDLESDQIKWMAFCK